MNVVRYSKIMFVVTTKLAFQEQLLSADLTNNNDRF